MNYTTTINPVLDALNNGQIIRRAFSVFIKVLAGLWIILGLAAIVAVLRFSFDGDAATIFAGILIAVLVVAYTGISVQVLIYRSKTIKVLEDSPFTIIPIISVWFRLIGELYATFIIFAAFSGLLAIAITGRNFLGFMLREYMPFDFGGDTFLGGLILLLTGVIAAFVIIMIAYWLAETTLIFADIAINIRKLAGTESKFKEDGSSQTDAKSKPPTWLKTARTKEDVNIDEI